MSAGTFGIISPHPPIMVEAVGGTRTSVTSSSIEALHTAARSLAAFDPDTVVIMSPHSPAFADAFLIDTASQATGSFAQFGAPSARYAYRGDPALAQDLLERLTREGIAAADRALDARMESGHLDHGVLVPMNFLDCGGRWPLVELSLSYLPYEMHRRVGELVAQTAESLGRRIAFVASGDLSHRLTRDAPAGYSPRAASLDAAIVDHVRRGDFVGLMHLDPEIVEAGGECGLRSFITLGGFLGERAPTRVLTYEGPWGVGYMTALAGKDAIALAGLKPEQSAASNAATVAPPDSPATPAAGHKGGSAGEDESEIVALARSTIVEYVRERRALEPEALTDPSLPERAGTFVSLHRNGELRGCIGTILPTHDTLAQEVVHNAIQAATHDPRFPPVGTTELGDLDIKVDVLRQPESCRIDELDQERYGVIVSSGWRRGLLLPDLDGVDDVRTQVEIAMRKAGIQPGEPCSFERFQVDRYE